MFLQYTNLYTNKNLWIEKFMDSMMGDKKKKKINLKIHIKKNRSIFKNVKPNHKSS